MFLHIVRKGDSLFEIGKRYKVDVNRLVSDNAILDPNKLVVGQSLIIRPENTKHVVEAGDTLTSIANRYGITVDQILNFNSNIESPESINVGDEIQIIFSNYNKEPMEINGYCYDNIDLDTLRAALPYLTYLSIFSYNIRRDGSLTSVNDDKLISEAYKYRVASLLTVTNMSSPGNFSGELVHDIFVNEAASNRLIEEILRKIQEKGYRGVNIDFEYLDPSDRENYNNFLREITARLNPLGYIVITALAPKTSADQPGILYEAHDYEAQNEIVNRIILMTYEWGYLYGPEMPVAPIDKVEEVIQYAVTAIDSNKILMGIPNYGYDFTLPFVEGRPARIITNNEAIKIAIDNNASIQYDAKAASPFIVYFQNGVEHNVHFEDARSIIEKITLAKDYNLGGLSYWTIMSDFPQNWIIVDYYIDVIKVL